MQELLDSLVPRPRRITKCPGILTLPQDFTYACVDLPTAWEAPACQLLQRQKVTLWHALEPPMAALLTLRRAALPPQAYQLEITPRQITLQACSAAGFFYGVTTLLQLLKLMPQILPAVVINDAPDFPVRGVMLDVSRDKIPSLETLFWLVDHLAALKLNQLQLYTEHTFAYAGHAEVWRTADPLTAAEIRALDHYCRQRCIDLVPNQNSFGHLERWLTLPRYRPLAELPQGGAPLPWGGCHANPTALCPTDPASLELLSDLYAQLLPNFSSQLFNVGCDEVFDLRGPGRSAALVQELGEGRVYLNFLQAIQRLVESHGRTMAFWGDIILEHPELVDELPRNVIALAWGYEADHPFESQCARFAASQIPFYVCPGTSSWNSLAGRVTNMRANLQRAAQSGHRHGAAGFLITDWGDGGHWQPLTVSLPAYLWGAALAWDGEANRQLDLAQALDNFGASEGLATVLLTLGDLYLECGAQRGNGTELYMLLSKPASRPVAAGVTSGHLQKILTQLRALEEQTCTAPASLVQIELLYVIAMLRLACRRGIALLQGDPIGTLQAQMTSLKEHHARIWRLRNRPGGLADSLAKFPRDYE